MGRRQRNYGRILAVLVTCCVTSATDVFGADREAEARERYERALRLYEERAFDAALVELKLAAELRPSYKLLYNIAQVRLAMNDFAAAFEAYRQYLEGGGDKIPADRRAAVQKEMKRLEQRVARVSIEADVPGAEVFVDDVSVGTTPLKGPLLVNTGTRVLVVRHPDYVPQSRRVSLGGGMQQSVRFVLSTPAPPVSTATGDQAGSSEATPVSPTAQPPGAPATAGLGTVPAVASQEPAPTPAPAPDEGKDVPWLAWGVTGALAAGTVAVGVWALAENSSLEDARNAQVSNAGDLQRKRDDLDSKSSRVSTLATVTDGLAVATLIAGGVSLWLTLDGPNKTKEQPASAAKVRVGVRSNQLVLAGEF